MEQELLHKYGKLPYNNTDSTQWTLVLDFVFDCIQIIQTVSYFEIWNDTLYFGTDAEGFLYQTGDGTTFTKNQSINNALGYGANKVIASIEVFNNELYISTNNPLQGGHVWRTSDGYNWTKITGNAFGKNDTIKEMRSLRTSFGNIWVTGYTDTNVSKGTPIWRSSDGLNWIQSNTDGFGNNQNNGENAVTIGFGNYQYFGGPNYNTGGQVWRTNMSTGVEEQSNNCETSLYPNPVSNGKSITIQANCNTQGQIQIYDLHGRLIQTSSMFHNGKVELDINEYESGIYFYRILAKDGELITGKFVIR